MVEELRKSINAILYERAASPLYGTFLFSWLIWNWKVTYVTFFVSEDYLEINKLDFIIQMINDWYVLLWYPILSTFILITLMPFISNGAYYLSLKFKKWRIDQRNAVEMKQLLSIEKSIELREEIRSQQEKFDRLLDSKNEEIKILEKQLSTIDEPSSNECKNPDPFEGSELEFKRMIESGRLDEFIEAKDFLFGTRVFVRNEIKILKPQLDSAYWKSRKMFFQMGLKNTF